MELISGGIQGGPLLYLRWGKRLGMCWAHNKGSNGIAGLSCKDQRDSDMVWGVSILSLPLGVPYGKSLLKTPGDFSLPTPAGRMEAPKARVRLDFSLGEKAPLLLMYIRHHPLGWRTIVRIVNRLGRL